MKDSITRRFLHVWRRNLLVYRRTWKINFLPPLLEPLFYLLAFGVGLAALVGRVVWKGEEISYIAFLAPALIAVNIMNSAFFENTYSSFVRMYYQKTFDAMLATPLSLSEIISAEILWGGTKSVIGTAIMMSVISAFGLLHYPHALLLLPVALLGGLAFGAIAMFFTSMMPNIEVFNLPVFLFITPMFLFSGTFFPLDTLPIWAQHLAVALPLTHLVNLTRAASYGEFNSDSIWGITYLVSFLAVFYPMALWRMRRRLIK